MVYRQYLPVLNHFIPCWLNFLSHDDSKVWQTHILGDISSWFRKETIPSCLISLKSCQICSHQASIILGLKCPYHQNLYFPIWSYISCNEHLQKNFSIWIKSDLLWMSKNLKILFSCCRPVPLITASTCSELWRRFRNVRLQAWVISLVLPL